ncbi:MAG: DNA methyltransferase [Anaerolineae bacterium CG_4_9_14_3_um_filter_57_17]|nr:site-specific DNA-methyltransferase [bacterium]NCT21333.1 site-specific DNA-methyltransferase [bacterium]OIO83681.1 MAG: DNA methyltransferase [Anaerolineae bacterium CG2_30_57_67]PJB65161.1 MAG: DNA methyltransferase [Anaerolineae bacterium CG_4_9_14_3_um_filter_57_17]
MKLPLNQILTGDCVESLNSLPEKSIDLVFADPPYNLQLKNELHRPNMTKVDAVDDLWDQFDTFEAYDEFTRKWLTACKRVLKPTGSIWVIGSYHNIFRVGTTLQDLGFWILNDVIWVKTNPMPNFRGVRFTNAHETLIWASPEQGAKYTFNYRAMKGLNEEKQMRSDWWLLSLATGSERIKDENGAKAHSTQKPEALLYRVILSSSNPGDVVLDPFFGSGTTGAIAKCLHRNWIGLEREEKYIQVAQKRIDAIQPETFDPHTFDTRSKAKSAPQVAFSALVENGFLQAGQKLFFLKDTARSATIKPDARIRTADGFEGSIHQAGSHYMNGSPCNGWEYWYLQENDGLISLDDVRQKYRLAELPPNQKPTREDPKIQAG